MVYSRATAPCCTGCSWGLQRRLGPAAVRFRVCSVVALSPGLLYTRSLPRQALRPQCCLCRHHGNPLISYALEQLLTIVSHTLLACILITPFYSYNYNLNFVSLFSVSSLNHFHNEMSLIPDTGQVSLISSLLSG